MDKIVIVVVHAFIFRIVDLINFTERVLAKFEFTYKLLLIPGFENFRWNFGAWRAWKNARRAYKKVPAYRKFVNKHGGMPDIMLNNSLMPTLEMLPEMDKENYVKMYSNEQRVVGGVLPRKGVMVDESSGSSGHPTSWVRGPKERALTKQMLQLSYHTVIGRKKVFAINAFALGAWATGLNVSMSLSDILIMKSTGPDLDKIINTMNEFGNKYHYIIMGYPPFLKNLADDDRIDWTKFTAEAVYGGEGISEGMRDYLLKTFSSVIGSYGASDLEINVAAENEFAIKLRRLIINDEVVRNSLIDTSIGSTPMVFQYNPLAYFMETNDKGELVVTFARSLNISPKIRYNIHDRGHVIKYGDLKDKLKELGKWQEFKSNPRKLDLPVLFLYGRSDMSIDFYGANVTPDSVREILYSIEQLAPVFNSFRLRSVEDKKHNKNMIVDVELTEGSSAKKLDEKTISDDVFKKLADINRDFYNAYFNTAPKDNLPKLSLHDFNTGPFEGGQGKLKHSYVETKLKYDNLNK